MAANISIPAPDAMSRPHALILAALVLGATSAACGGPAAALPAKVEPTVIVVPPAAASVRAPGRDDTTDGASVGRTPFVELAEIVTSEPSPGPGRVWLVSYDEKDGTIDAAMHAPAASDYSAVLQRFASVSALASVTVLEVQPVSDEPPVLRVRFKAKVAFARNELPQVGRALALRSAEDAARVLPRGALNPFEPPAASPPGATPAQSPPVEDLKLLATLGTRVRRAMFVDAKHSPMGWIVVTGDLVGIEPCRYRVSAIHDADVVLDKVGAAVCPGQPSRRTVRLTAPKTPP